MGETEKGEKNHRANHGRNRTALDHIYAELIMIEESARLNEEQLKNICSIATNMASRLTLQRKAI